MKKMNAPGRRGINIEEEEPTMNESSKQNNDLNVCFKVNSYSINIPNITWHDFIAT